MKKMSWNKIYHGHTPIKVLGITLLVFLMLMSVSGAVPFAYITNLGSNNVSVIDTATNKITATVKLESTHFPFEVAIIPDGSKVYFTNPIDNIVSVINTSTNSIAANVPVGAHPRGVAVAPEGKNVY